MKGYHLLIILSVTTEELILKVEEMSQMGFKMVGSRPHEKLLLKEIIKLLKTQSPHVTFCIREGRLLGKMEYRITSNSFCDHSGPDAAQKMILSSLS